jgi:hypothetical protein
MESIYLQYISDFDNYITSSADYDTLYNFYNNNNVLIKSFVLIHQLDFPSAKQRVLPNRMDGVAVQGNLNNTSDIYCICRVVYLLILQHLKIIKHIKK